VISLQLSVAGPTLNGPDHVSPGSPQQLLQTQASPVEFGSLLSRLFEVPDAEPQVGVPLSNTPAKANSPNNAKTTKDSPKPSKDSKERGSPLIISTPVVPEPPKPPIRLSSDHGTPVAQNYEMSTEESASSRAAASDTSTEAVAAETASVPPPQVPQATSQAGQLVFAVQLTEMNQKNKSAPQGSPTVQVGTTSKTGSSNTTAVAPSSVAHAPTVSDQNTSSSEKEPSKDNDEESIAKQLATSEQGAPPMAKPDPGVSLSAVEPKSGPVKSSEPAAPPAPLAASDTKVESKNEINTTARPQPAKEISLRVPLTDSTVDLKVTESAGKVQVSVRSADPDLARSIQSGMGDLVDHLDKKGYDTETWVPSERGLSAPGLTESSSANNESGNSQQRSGAGSEQQGQGRQSGQNQGQNQGQRPKWLDALESGLSLDNSSGVNIQ
jgi:hypothetical protein